MVADCARPMRDRYPQHAGRWGCYLVNGTNVGYPGLNPAIDALLDARAMIACELYAKQADYNAAGDTKGERDIWLGDFFRGSRGAFRQGRLHWLVQRRKSRGSRLALSAPCSGSPTSSSATTPTSTACSTSSSTDAATAA